MSDARLGYLLNVAGPALPDMRSATVVRLDAVWRSLDAVRVAPLQRGVLPHAARLLGAPSAAVAALACRLFADVVAAEHTRYFTVARLERRLIQAVDDDAAAPGAAARFARLARVLATALPQALAERQGGVSDWFGPTLVRVLDLVNELRELLRTDASELERALAHGRLVSASGPLLRPDALGQRVPSTTKRAAKHARGLAQEMAMAGHHVEAGLALLRSAESEDAAGSVDDDAEDAEEDRFNADDDAGPAMVRRDSKAGKSSRSLQARRPGDDSPLPLAKGDGADALVAFICGARAGRLAAARRAAQKLFDAATPPATELSVACAEASCDELRRAVRDVALAPPARLALRRALSWALRGAADYYDALEPGRRHAAPHNVYRARLSHAATVPARLRGREFAFRADAGEPLMEFIARFHRQLPHCKLALAASTTHMGALVCEKPHDDGGGDGERTPDASAETAPSGDAVALLQASTLTPVGADDEALALAPGDFIRALLDQASHNWPAPLGSASALFDADSPWQPWRVWAHEWPVRVGDAAARGHEESVLDLWLERRLVLLAAPLAAATRWVPVSLEYSTRLNPLELALRQLRGKNAELGKTLVQLDLAPDGGAQQRHTMAINGVVDAAVNGGLWKWGPFFDRSHLQTHPEIQSDVDAHPHKRKLFPDFVQALRDHVGLVRKCVEAHQKKCAASLRPLAQHIENVSWPRLENECATIIAMAQKSIDDER